MPKPNPLPKKKQFDVKATRKKLRDYILDPENPNAGTPRGAAMLEHSIGAFGPARSGVVDKDGVMRAGNHTAEQLFAAGIENVIEVETTGDEWVIVKRPDWTEEQAELYAISDNRSGELISFDPAVLAALEAKGRDLRPFWDDKEKIALLQQASQEQTDDKDAPFSFSSSDVPDAVWPTDNEWGIPLLDLRMQADAIDQPLYAWGAGGSRLLKRHGGTYHFYTEDSRFEALWTDPSLVLNSGCITAVEPNFSCYENMPRAVALHQVYRKRWISRWWQSQGLRVVVDLNVAAPHYDLNLLGVPDGWTAFATRGYTERIDLTDAEYEQACKKAGDRTPLFLVYGGGQQVRAHCLQRGWLWFPEQRDVAKGKFVDG